MDDREEVFDDLIPIVILTVEATNNFEFESMHVYLFLLFSLKR